MEEKGFPAVQGLVPYDFHGIVSLGVDRGGVIKEANVGEAHGRWRIDQRVPFYSVSLKVKCDHAARRFLGRLTAPIRISIRAWKLSI